jgi:cytochrome bd-type quinol oxidase subunit 2
LTVVRYLYLLLTSILCIISWTILSLTAINNEHSNSSAANLYSYCFIWCYLLLISTVFNVYPNINSSLVNLFFIQFIFCVILVSIILVRRLRASVISIVLEWLKLKLHRK